MQMSEHTLSNVGSYVPLIGHNSEPFHLRGGGAVGELEKRLETYYGMQHALCVSNATLGLLAVQLALGLKGVEILTTPYSWGGTVAGALLLGNRLAFGDIDAVTLTLDPDTVRNAISPHTKAILAVDVDGTPSDSSGLRQVADEYGLWYITDAAESFGATREGHPASYDADALVLSFGPGKPLDVGEGGAILTSSQELYEKLLWHTQHPERQRLELGLHLDNESCLTGRIHPAAVLGLWGSVLPFLLCFPPSRCPGRLHLQALQKKVEDSSSL